MIIEIHKPELENLIRERMASGEYQNIEDVLIEALMPLTESNQTAQPASPKKRLGQFLLESPLRGSGLKVERQKDYPRPTNL